MIQMTHFVARQTVLRELPQFNGVIVDYLPKNDLVMRVADFNEEWMQVFTGTLRHGYVLSEFLEAWTAPFEGAADFRLPADEVIDQAAGNRRPAQYIHLEALGFNQVKYNLCGQFCAAALGGLDVLPFLRQWMAASPRAKLILTRDLTTGITDLQGMLHVAGKDWVVETYAYPTPLRVEKALPAIAGVGINRRGKVSSLGTIRHWVVILGMQREGYTGWVQIYNPYWNRTEFCLYDDLLDPSGRLVLISVL